MLWRLLYSGKSSSEHCTLYQLRNVLNRHNVRKKPIKDFNACDDFFMTILTSHIIVAAMKHLHIDSQSQTPPDLPNAEDLWMLSKQERKDLLDGISAQILWTSSL